MAPVMIQKSKRLLDLEMMAPSCRCGLMANKKTGGLLAVKKDCENKGRRFYKCWDCKFFTWYEGDWKCECGVWSPAEAESCEICSSPRPEAGVVKDWGVASEPGSLDTTPKEGIGSYAAPSCLCGNSLPCKTVKKQGDNHGRLFYSCTDCNYFQWGDAWETQRREDGTFWAYQETETYFVQPSPTGRARCGSCREVMELNSLRFVTSFDDASKHCHLHCTSPALANSAIIKAAAEGGASAIDGVSELPTELQSQVVAALQTIASGEWIHLHPELTELEVQAAPKASKAKKAKASKSKATKAKQKELAESESEVEYEEDSGDEDLYLEDQEPQKEEEGKEAFCLCRRPDDGSQMIGCDNDDCTIVWFHLKCLGKKKVPKGKWFCDACAAEKKGTKRKARA